LLYGELCFKFAFGREAADLSVTNGEQSIVRIHGDAIDSRPELICPLAFPA
jgi:hypothetical protein